MNCGAECAADQCLACGMTPDAAEVLLRRRLLNRTAIFLVGALLLVNGFFDRLPASNAPASVISKFSMRAPLQNRRLIVTSWREGRRIERVAVGADDFSRFHPGDRIVVRVQEGLIGIPWVAGVYRELPPGGR